ncbi:group IID secretory phospholipase A2 [Pteropus alecto]|uniref:Phospholipase A2 n=1 Tax=Pteropus alecto TaxID=9402 RepID=L5JT89_PTEAL|nr:group IID secretory phospholipase A2 [Pteropus alecto]ELK02197.1 Group IID secretory phospholipase A2 [Pteropus alecto]
MELLQLCMLVVFAGACPTQGGILNLNDMVKQMTEKTPIISYWFYGCHCGLGGKGPPLDATDRCCHAHDCCYAHLRHHRCRLHTDHYNYNFSHGDIQCSDKGSWCEQELCACDKEVAFCLQRHLGSYKKKLRFTRQFWPSRCKGKTPMC